MARGCGGGGSRSDGMRCGGGGGRASTARQRTNITQHVETGAQMGHSTASKRIVHARLDHRSNSTMMVATGTHKKEAN
jgi:hypothetical protein